MEPLDELRHIRDGASPDEVPDGWARRAISLCQDASSVHDRSAEALSAVVEAGPTARSVDEWMSILPSWFVAACASDRTHEQAEEDLREWRALSEPDKRTHAETERSTLSGWTHWFTNEDRWWYWWDSHVIDTQRLEVVVEMPDVQAGLGSLRWLLRAAGATSVDFD